MFSGSACPLFYAGMFHKNAAQKPEAAKKLISVKQKHYEFLKTEKERRDFAKMASVKLEKKIEQLEKSKLMLKNLSELDECFN